MTRRSRPRRFSLAGVCAAAISAGGMLLPATAFALPGEPCHFYEEGCLGGSGSAGIFGGPVIPPAPGIMDPPAPGVMEPDFRPRRCHYDYEIRRMVCE